MPATSPVPTRAGRLARFDADCSSGRIVLTPLHLGIAHAAADLFRRLKLPQSRVGLRSLATAIAARATAVVTTDARLREASLLAGLCIKP